MFTPLFQALPKNSRVLFIRLRNLGEAVLDTANLRALKSYRPDLQLTTMVESVFSELYEGDPEINVLRLERNAGQRRSSIGARLDAVRRIRQGKFAAVVNLHGGPASAQMIAASGIRQRAGAEHFRFGSIYNHRIPDAGKILKRSNLHTVESQFAAFQWLGLPGDPPANTSLHVDSANSTKARARLSAVGLNVDRPYAVLAPTNEFYTKRWMPDRFARIAEQLLESGYQVIMTGAPTTEQREQLRNVNAASSERLISISDAGIGELVAIIAGARLFVGNDSGPAHIAAAVNTPLVVMFGPASSERWRPWTSRAQLVQNYFPCNPCSMYTCDAFPEPECIRSISVDQVMTAIERVLER